MSTPICWAYSGSIACSASMNAQTPPSFWASAMHVVDERRLARGLRAEDLDDAPARHAADAEREVERQRAGGDRVDLDLRALVAHAHDGALAELALDLGERALQGGVAGLGGLLVYGHSVFDLSRARNAASVGAAIGRNGRRTVRTFVCRTARAASRIRAAAARVPAPRSAPVPRPARSGTSISRRGGAAHAPEPAASVAARRGPAAAHARDRHVRAQRPLLGLAAELLQRRPTAPRVQRGQRARDVLDGHRQHVRAARRQPQRAGRAQRAAPAAPAPPPRPLGQRRRSRPAGDGRGSAASRAALGGRRRAAPRSAPTTPARPARAAPARRPRPELERRRRAARSRSRDLRSPSPRRTRRSEVQRDRRRAVAHVGALAGQHELAVDPRRRRPARRPRSRPSPTGFSSVPPPGPAMPVMPTPTSAPSARDRAVGQRRGDLGRHRAVALDQRRVDAGELDLRLVGVDDEAAAARRPRSPARSVSRAGHQPAGARLGRRDRARRRRAAASATCSSTDVAVVGEQRARRGARARPPRTRRRSPAAAGS